MNSQESEMNKGYKEHGRLVGGGGGEVGGMPIRSRIAVASVGAGGCLLPNSCSAGVSLLRVG